jgi:RNA polymerase sigma factor (TIGR02999 family)
MRKWQTTMDMSPGEITTLLQQWASGDREALSQVVEKAYDEFRAIAHAYLRRERANSGVNTTVLVHEFYLRLFRQREPSWEDRKHFYTFAAHMMRLILVDHARSAMAVKRGPEREVVTLDPQIAGRDEFQPEVLDLHAALTDLENLDARKARLVELHYFSGCKVAEAAEVMGISVATAERDLLFSRSWLHTRIRGRS